MKNSGRADSETIGQNKNDLGLKPPEVLDTNDVESDDYGKEASKEDEEAAVGVAPPGEEQANLNDGINDGENANVDADEDDVAAAAADGDDEDVNAGNDNEQGDGDSAAENVNPDDGIQDDQDNGNVVDDDADDTDAYPDGVNDDDRVEAAVAAMPQQNGNMNPVMDNNADIQVANEQKPVGNNPVQKADREM